MDCRIKSFLSFLSIHFMPITTRELISVKFILHLPLCRLYFFKCIIYVSNVLIDQHKTDTTGQYTSRIQKQVFTKRTA